MSCAVPVQSDGFNSALSPVVYGDIALSINTQYKKKEKKDTICYCPTSACASSSFTAVAGLDCLI